METLAINTIATISNDITADTIGCESVFTVHPAVQLMIYPLLPSVPVLSVVFVPVQSAVLNLYRVTSLVPVHSVFK